MYYCNHKSFVSDTVFWEKLSIFPSFHCIDKVNGLFLDQQSSQNKSETMLESYIYVHRLSLFVICIKIDISVLSF